MTIRGDQEELIMRHFEKFEAVRDFMVNEASKNNGLVNMGYKQISEQVGVPNMSSVRNYLLKMMERGELLVEIAPKRGTTDATYRVTGVKGVSLTSSSTESNVIIIEWGGIELHLKRMDIGIVIGMDELGLATLESQDVIMKIVKANEELFSKNICEVDEKIYFNRNAILLYMLRLNTNRVLSYKKQALIEFNTVVLSKMCESMIVGRCVLTESERAEIRSNISCLTEITIDQVSEMFAKLEDDFNNIIHIFQGKVSEQINETKRVEKKLNQINGLYDATKKTNEKLHSEIVEMRGKLLDRTSVN